MLEPTTVSELEPELKSVCAINWTQTGAQIWNSVWINNSYEMWTNIQTIIQTNDNQEDWCCQYNAMCMK